MSAARDALSPREVADRLGFSYHAVLRAIRRGELQASEPIKGQYRIDLEEYERWRHTPRSERAPTQRRAHRRSRRDQGTSARLKALEGGR